MKLATIIVSRTRCIFAKLLAVPENSVKVKVTNKDFCMDTKLPNIFKNANAKTLVKTIIERFMKRNNL